MEHRRKFPQYCGVETSKCKQFKKKTCYTLDPSLFDKLINYAMKKLEIDSFLKKKKKSSLLVLVQSSRTDNASNNSSTHNIK